jgi:TetR/AcrR family transcriptional regulator
MTRPARISPERILAAAALEFAGRGFAGATVDRIARRARVNKAMLYYHFGSKRALYRTLLRRMFTLARERICQIADSPRTPSEKVDALIVMFIDLIREHASFPAIMLREVAEGGHHLDRETLAALAAVPAAVAGIVQEGVSNGTFRAVNPLFVHFSLLAPIVFFLAGDPIRAEIAHLHLMNVPVGTRDEFVHHMQEAARRTLARDLPPMRPTR